MKQIKTKVIIVGSGGAGLRCAIELYEQGLTDILIVGDRAFDDAHTTQARGGINAALHTMDKEDSPLVHAVDTYREGQGLAHPDLVEFLADEASGAIDDLISRGAQFHHEDDGRLTQRFFGAHSYRRTVFSGDETGKEMIRVMSKKAKDLGIPYLEHCYVYELLTGNDADSQRAIGVLAIDQKNNEEIEMLAPRVVFATGGYSNVYARSSSRNKENFGDGIGIAFRAGVVIGDIELIQFHPTGLMFPEEKAGELVTEAMRGEGAVLLNSRGERFMKKYDPVKQELSTRDVVARANFQEIQEGRGTERGAVFLDISHREKEYIKERLPKMHSMILKWNQVDITEGPVEVSPTTHYTMGGILFDPKTMETSLKGFYSAGECTMGVHGANRLGGNSLMETMVFGKRVAQKILSQSFDQSSEINPSAGIGDQQVQINIQSGGVDPHDLLTRVRQSVRSLAGIVRVDSELQELKGILESESERFLTLGMQAQNSAYENMMIWNRCWSVLTLAKLICHGAIERKESRGAHFRSDYLEMSESYDKNFLHQLQDGTIESTWKAVPGTSARLAQGLQDFERTKNYGHSE